MSTVTQPNVPSTGTAPHDHGPAHGSTSLSTFLSTYVFS